MMVICAGCGHPVEVICAPREQLRSFASTVPALIRLGWTPAALGHLLLVTTALCFLGALGPRAWLATRLLELGWLFAVMQRSTRGWPPFGLFTYADLIAAWRGPLPRFVLASAPLLIGASLLVNVGQRAAVLFSVGSVALVGLAILLMPGALVSSAVEGAGPQWRWPWQLLVMEKKLAGDLPPVRAAAAVFVALQLLSACLAPLTLADDMRLFEHIVRAWVAHAASVAGLMGLATLAGGLVHHRAASLGHGDPETWLAVAVHGAKPLGHWTPPAPQVELDAQAKRYAPISLEDPREQLQSAIARGDAAAVREKLLVDGVDPVLLTFEELISASQILAGDGAPEPAARMLEGMLLRQPRHALAPRAMVILARLMAERLQRPDEAHALYRQALERFPGTEAARFAEARLSDAATPGETPRRR
jgi:hypothetical protein